MAKTSKKTTKKNVEKDQKFTDVIKKVVQVGASSIFLTDDAVRNLLQDLPVPTDILSGIISNAKKSKEDFLGSVKDEIAHFIKKIDLSHLVDEVARNYDIEVQTKIKLIPKKKTKKS